MKATERRKTLGSLQLAGLVLGNTWQERIIPGIQVTIIGMTVVFSVLIMLYGILVLLGRFGGGGEAAQPADRHAQTPAGTAAATAAITAAVAAAPGQADAVVSAAAEGVLVAVISAALAATGMEERPALRPAGRARRIPARLGWTLAGRMELLTAREQLPRG